MGYYPQHLNWIGKKIVYYNGGRPDPTNVDVVNELDIALYTQPYDYRFLYTRLGRVINKPIIDKIPTRFNIFINENGIITDVRKF